MRPSCYECVLKHILEASITMSEAEQGYPLHAWIAWGYLSEAANEAVQKDPDLAGRLREDRQAYKEVILGRSQGYQFPLMEYVRELDTKIRNEIELPTVQLPEDTYGD